MSIQEKNKELMITLDNAWNSQDWDIFNEQHVDNVAVFWPGQPDPTRGVHNHRHLLKPSQPSPSTLTDNILAIKVGRG